MAIEIISTLKPKNNGTFPIAEAKDITVDENGTRLDAKLTELANNAGSGSGGSYVLELTAESGTLTDEQYNAVVANAPNVVASLGGELIFPYKGYYAGNNEHQFEIVTQQTGGEDGSTIVSLYLTIEADKSYSMRVTESQFASKTYVDNAVANAGGSGGGGSSDGGRTLKVIECATAEELFSNIYAHTDAIFFKVITEGVMALMYEDESGNMTTLDLEGTGFDVAAANDGGVIVIMKEVGLTGVTTIIMAEEDGLVTQGILKPFTGTECVGVVDFSNVSKFKLCYF